jgi:hypothetical protein|mmetsp:Transcript_85747/g.135418  ORF Transcript_85747/g.135418 Transcript_85747/m.135418 type:complete len:272 (-) Transcript_85747:230-1045(-)|eukprot:CAMPEP_0169246996 /NCGR_PEP_ID=MMETSP1016-20121227/35045_1 /TAXON_ID=342587 /ORGANISM="Karlodinium micrum, Strain CCMP2283" /LENGTH=271 /DNA_ID=CAMNT_0009327639 /DNA_START=34 /DNA_END=849 /DNA_ORIENTATION=-
MADKDGVTSSQKLLTATDDPRKVSKLDNKLESEETIVEIEYKIGMNLLEVLAKHSKSTVHVHIANVIDMVADIRSVSRTQLLQNAVVAWFYYALGFPVLEAECKEQSSEEDVGEGLLLFRALLDADYNREVAALPEWQDLGTSFRDKLVGALPGQSADVRSSGRLNKMVKVNHTEAQSAKPGSIELGGVASLHVVILVVMAIGLGHCKCEVCSCDVCPCFHRPGRKEGMEYACAVRALRDRGTDFEVNVDGTATMRIPPETESNVAWCSIL